MYIIEQPNGAVLLSTHNVCFDGMLRVFKKYNEMFQVLTTSLELRNQEYHHVFCCDVDQFWLESMLSNRTHFVDYEGQNIHFIKY